MRSTVVIAALLWLTAIGPVYAQSGEHLVLITEQEAKLPQAPNTTLSFRAGITRGPKVVLVTPESSEITSPVRLRLKFETYGGAKIDPASIKFTYLKNPAVDLTDRLRPVTQPGGIDISAAEIPPGVHHIRVDLKDDAGRSGIGNFTLNVRQ